MLQYFLHSSSNRVKLFVRLVWKTCVCACHSNISMLVRVHVFQDRETCSEDM